jgi:hypothetical protein
MVYPKKYFEREEWLNNFCDEISKDIFVYSINKQDNYKIKYVVLSNSIFNKTIISLFKLTLLEYILLFKNNIY